MRRCRFFFCVLLLTAAHLGAQQQEMPSPTPGEPKPPAGPSRPSAPPAPAVIPVPITPPRPNGPVQKSLVRITATAVEPDYKAPWNAGVIARGIGAGFVIDGSRIMTNAHVVSNSRYLTVERDGDPNSYSGYGPVCRPRLRSGADHGGVTEFFKNMTPLRFGAIPELESVVSAYGYPRRRADVRNHGDCLTDRLPTLHSFIGRSHLTIQISAQINPGNRVDRSCKTPEWLALPFRASGDVAQGVAYMTPTPVIQRFLRM